MQEVLIPFPDYINPNEIKSFYLSCLIRFFCISGNKLITKVYYKDFKNAMEYIGWNRKRILDTWKYAIKGQFFNYIGEDYIILRGKEKVQGEKGFMTRVYFERDIGFYKFTEFVTYMYTIRPVTQTEEFKFKYKFKKNSSKYNRAITKKSLTEKKGRGTNRISKQSGCCQRTVINRQKKLIKDKKIKVVKRYTKYNGFKIGLTNLYFTLQKVCFFNYHKKLNSVERYRTILNNDHNISLIKGKVNIFLDNCLRFFKGDLDVYEAVKELRLMY